MSTTMTRTRMNMTSATAAATALVAFLLPLLVLLLVGPEATGAIKCWECNSSTDPDCEAISGETAREGNARFVDCEAKQDFDYILCRKSVQDVDGTSRVIRSCGFENADKDCYSTANPPVKTTVCQCFEDGCNPAARPAAPSLSLTLLAGGLLGLLYCYLNKRPM